MRHHKDLDAWRLAHELEIEVFRFTANPAPSRDVEFCRQIRASSGSAAANIAEGFWRFRPSEFAHFLNIARGSLGETQNHLQKAAAVGYLDAEHFDVLWHLSDRAIGATTRLYRYLRSVRSGPRRAGVRTQNPEP